MPTLRSALDITAEGYRCNREAQLTAVAALNEQLALARARVDAGVAAGSEVGVHYDPMLAKVTAHGPTREGACRRLARALAETRVHGVVTNRELLVGILREPEFRAGLIDTGYLTRHDPHRLARSWFAPDADRVSELPVVPGQQVDTGAVLAVVTEEDR
jgi:acetyl/propionyl-CoA carboxylase alpha subunit